MSEKKDLKKLQAKRAELEAESRSLKEEQKKLEDKIKILEEQIVIDELHEKNKTTKDAISHLETKLHQLESRLKQKPQPPTESPSQPPPTENNEEMIAPPAEGIEKTPESAEVAPEDIGENDVTITAIDNEALVEAQEASNKKQEKKKHRFF